MIPELFERDPDEDALDWKAMRIEHGMFFIFRSERSPMIPLQALQPNSWFRQKMPRCQKQKNDFPMRKKSSCLSSVGLLLIAQFPLLINSFATTGHSLISGFSESRISSTLSNGFLNARISQSRLNLVEAPFDVIHGTINEVSSLSVSVTEAAENAELANLGHDIFVFLLVSVVVVPLSKALKLSPVLGFLVVGCLIGPFGLQIFSCLDADQELGDFGILFLLFNEGLSLSTERIKELGRFTGLGVVQLLISIGMIFVGTFWGGPVILKYVQEIGVPLDYKLVKPIVDNPVQSFCIASAGALSSSAFVLPILKQKKWEDRPEGIAGLSILLLQDLAVAPLLVILPLLAGSGPSTSVELGILVTKATVGFGALLAAGSVILSYVFEVVAATRSTETFVAAALLVAVGMGQAADFLGLSASTGAFAAGVLLAGNRYRAQIQADIKPFEGILLGIFFTQAGANLDPSLVAREWLTLSIGIIAFIATKAGIIFASGPTLGLTRAQAARVSLTLAGGGEFALVLFKLAQDLGVLPKAIAKLLEASVIISMSLTPLLSNVGARLGNILDGQSAEIREDGLTAAEEEALFNEIDTDGSGTIEIEELREALIKLDFPFVSIAEIFSKFDTNGDGIIDKDEWKAGVAAGYVADSWISNEDGARGDTSVKFSEDALIVLGYGEMGKTVCQMLSASAEYGRTQGQVVCFDLNPSRVTAGVIAGAPVVYGDGGNVDLLRATGVTKPRGVVITFASDDRRIDATLRLRSTLPKDTPIFVYAGNSGIAPDLNQAGATEVISDTAEAVLRFGDLLGTFATLESAARFRNELLMAPGQRNQKELSIEYLADLSERFGISPRETKELWEFFFSIAGERDTVAITDLKELMIRSAEQGPKDEVFLDACLELEDEDGGGDLTFVEFVQASTGECRID